MRIHKTLPTLALASALAVGGLTLPRPADAADVNISLGLGDSDEYGYDGYRDDGYGSDNSIGADDLLSVFFTAALNHFGSSERDIYLIQDQGISEREIPVVLYLARKTGVSPMTIANLRASGYSWSDITYRLGMNSEIYYVPLSGYYGSYATYYRTPRSRWSSLRLSDDAVIGLVNTRFMSDYYRTSPERIVRLRSSGSDYMHIAREFYRPERHGQLRHWSRHGATRHSTLRQKTSQQPQIIERRVERRQVTREQAQPQPQREVIRERQVIREQVQPQRQMNRARVQVQREENRERGQQQRQMNQERRQERQQAQASRKGEMRRAKASKKSEKQNHKHGGHQD